MSPALPGLPPRPPDPQEIWNDRVTVTVYALVGTATECIFYGFHVVLVFLLFTNYGGQWHQRYLSLSVSGLIFVISSAIWLLGLYLAIKGVNTLRQQELSGPPMFVDDLEWIRCSLFTVAMLFGDAVLSWRVWVLYRRALWILVPQMMALLTAIGLGLASSSCMIRMSAGLGLWESVPCARITFTGQQGTWVASAFLNVSSAALLVHMAWRHNSVLRHSGMNKNNVIRVLYILAGSSTLYCLLWIPLLALIFIQAAQSAPTFISPLDLALLVLQSAFHQLVGIYPTVVTYLTLQTSPIFGTDSARSRRRTSEYGTGTIRFTYPDRSSDLHVTIDETVQVYEETTPSAGKQFLPIEMDNLSPRRPRSDEKISEETKRDDQSQWAWDNR